MKRMASFFDTIAAFRDASALSDFPEGKQLGQRRSSTKRTHKRADARVRRFTSDMLPKSIFCAYAQIRRK